MKYPKFMLETTLEKHLKWHPEHLGSFDCMASLDHEVQERRQSIKLAAKQADGPARGRHLVARSPTACSSVEGCFAMLHHFYHA